MCKDHFAFMELLDILISLAYSMEGLCEEAECAYANDEFTEVRQRAQALKRAILENEMPGGKNG